MGAVLRLYDSRTQQVRPLQPLVPGRIGLYVCGPTVQSSPHIGHLRSALAYDLLRRWLVHRGNAVTMVRNVTDIDDKVLSSATEAEPWWALAHRVELEFQDAYRAIGIQPPTVEPRATGNVDRMQALIVELIQAGHAYAAPDGSGDVYFDTRSWPSYGELTRQRREDMVAAEDADPRGKRDGRDFALWKGTKSGEPQSAAWPSPWGRGRPGWHIECSAMAERYLGAAFDIHGGGLDLRFPHHENELAQSSAVGRPFARHWVHNGLVTVDGQKMSKSLGNSVFAVDLTASARPAAVRYALIAAHYRSSLDLQSGSLGEAEEALGRIERFRARASQAVGRAGPQVLPAAFEAAMDDDLAVPVALAVLHDTVRAGNVAIDSADAEAARRALGATAAMISVLGLDFADPAGIAGGGSAPVDTGRERALDTLIAGLVEQRAAARANRDWPGADRIRDLLADAGVQVEDTAGATRWSIVGSE